MTTAEDRARWAQIDTPALLGLARLYYLDARNRGHVTDPDFDSFCRRFQVDTDPNRCYT